MWAAARPSRPHAPLAQGKAEGQGRHNAPSRWALGEKGMAQGTLQVPGPARPPHQAAEVVLQDPPAEKVQIDATLSCRHPHLVNPFRIFFGQGRDQVGLKVAHPLPGGAYSRKTLGGKRAFRNIRPGTGSPFSQATPPFFRGKRSPNRPRADVPRKSPRRSQTRSSER